MKPLLSDKHSPYITEQTFQHRASDIKEPGYYFNTLVPLLIPQLLCICFHWLLWNVCLANINDHTCYLLCIRVCMKCTIRSMSLNSLHCHVLPSSIRKVLDKYFTLLTPHVLKCNQNVYFKKYNFVQELVVGPNLEYNIYITFQ